MRQTKFFVPVLIVVLLITSRCTEKKCSDIDMSRLMDIQLPDVVNAGAKDLAALNDALDVYLPRDFKLIIKCTPEKNFENGAILPGVVLWITDHWDIASDTSRLGKYFYERNIGTWERSQLVVIVYHRHLNKTELQIDGLIKDAEVKTEFKGRVSTVTAYQTMDSNEIRTLKGLIKKVDSLNSVTRLMELKAVLNKKGTKTGGKIVAQKDSIFLPLQRLSTKTANDGADENDLILLGKTSYRKDFLTFESLKQSQKIILMEKVKLEILVKENEQLSSIL